MFGHASDPSRIWTYGALRPSQESAQGVGQQMWLAHRYYNDLVELELDRRKAVNEASREMHPGLAHAEDELGQALEGVEEALTLAKAENAKARKRVAEGTLLKERRALVKELRQRVREQRNLAREDPALIARLDQINQDFGTRHKMLREASGCYWGTYLMVEQSVMAAKKGPKLHFKRWDGNGHLAVQIQKGMSVQELFSGLDPRLRLEQSSSPGLHTVHFRIGSNGREPIWAVLPAIIHRRPPEKARVKWAHLIRRRVGTVDRWEFQLVLANKEGWDREDWAKEGTCAVDCNWRLREDGGLRVCSWVGSDGKEGHLGLPFSLVNLHPRADRLEGIRDRIFDGMIQTLNSWLKGFSCPTWVLQEESWLKNESAREKARGKERRALSLKNAAEYFRRLYLNWPEQAMNIVNTNEALQQAAPHLTHWKSQGRLAALLLRWREQRFDGDSYMLQVVETWRWIDKHLCDWAANERRAAANRREWLYRNFARELARRYKRILVPDTDWRQLLQKPDPDKKDETALARQRRRVAAVGLLSRYLREAACQAVDVDESWSTQRCAECGKRETFDAKKDLTHTCSHCGANWDQDTNAARIILGIDEGRLEPIKGTKKSGGNGQQGTPE
jgi:hypothetical protein